MIHETKKDGTYTYLFTERDAVFSTADIWNEDLTEAVDEWKDILDEKGWIPIDDPLPHCQHDCILPIRIKGRESGTPQWGHYEILTNGQWVDYTPKN